MSDEIPVVTITSNTTTTPDEISRKTFPQVRKGVDGEAVRRFLDTIADDMRGLLEQHNQLRRRLAEAERKAAEPPVLDEATLDRAVGEETARVLQTARDAAREVVARGEARAAELIAAAEEQMATRRTAADAEVAAILEAAAEQSVATAADAQAEANALREAAEAEADAVVQTARDDAVSLLDTTKHRCRQTVRQARRLRNEVLSDLVERRRALFVQLEQLRTGRDSLVEVVGAVEETVEALKAALTGAEHDARMAAAEAGDRAVEIVDAEMATLMEPDVELESHSELLGEDELGESDEGSEETAVAEVTVEPVVDLAEETLAVDEEDEEHVVRARDTAASHRSVGELFARIRAARQETGGEEAEPEPEPGATPDQPLADVPANEEIPAEDAVAEGDEVGDDEAAADEADSDEAEAEDAEAEDEVTELVEVIVVVDDTAEDEADSESEESDDEGDTVARRRRDELLNPVSSRLARALKRALQDDQNELLTALRRSTGALDLEELLPAEGQRERFALAAGSVLADSWLVGRTWLLPDGSPDPGHGAEATEIGRDLGRELATELAGLLRHRLNESLAAFADGADGAQDAAGAAYREWKGPRVEGVAGDFATRAFSAGAVAAGEGTLVRWVVDDGRPCPDCDDNVLAGEQPAGEPWPTGQIHPPVHPGCRCLLVVTTA